MLISSHMWAVTKKTPQNTNMDKTTKIARTLVLQQPKKWLTWSKTKGIVSRSFFIARTLGLQQPKKWLTWSKTKGIVSRFFFIKAFLLRVFTFISSIRQKSLIPSFWGAYLSQLDHDRAFGELWEITTSEFLLIIRIYI